MQITSDMTPAKPRNRRRPAYVARLGAAAAIGAGLVVAALPAGQAVAAIYPSSPGSTVANVQVGSAITLSNLTSSFRLTGNPGQTIVGLGVVTMNVETNNATGYHVTVQAAAPNLVGTPPNPDVIPINDLSVRETAAGNNGPFTPLSNTTPVTVHDQITRSIPADGDALSNDYQIVIPNVNSDTYHVTLNYIATTNT
jgi:hypothetical protein